MKNALVIMVLAAALGLSGCATSANAGKKAAKSNIQKVFKKGSKVCTWTDGKGKKGTDYFYKDKTAWSGSADRVIGNKTKQGTWQVTGSALNMNWYGGKKGKGRWYKIAGTGKKSFDATTSDGAEKYSMKCK